MITKTTMLSYIKKEQNYLEKILQTYPQQFSSLTELLEHKKHWLILATGSSYNAALSAKNYLEKISEIQISIKEPYNFVNYEPVPYGTDLVIGISQSGQSTSTLAAMKKCRQNNLSALIGITSQIDKEISKVCNQTVDILIGKEQVGYVTLGFNATVLTLMLLGLQAASINNKIDKNKENSELKEFSAIVHHINPAIKKSEDFYQDFKPIFANSPEFLTIAYGAGLGSAGEMQTKFTEVVRYPAYGWEIESFMHGPYLGIKDNYTEFFIHLNANKNILKKEKELKQFENTCTPYIFTINLGKKQEQSDGQILNLMNVSDETKTSILAVIPFQVLSWYIAKDKGVNLSHLIFDNFSDIVHNKTEHQNYI